MHGYDQRMTHSTTLTASPSNCTAKVQTPMREPTHHTTLQSPNGDIRDNKPVPPQQLPQQRNKCYKWSTHLKQLHTAPKPSHPRNTKHARPPHLQLVQCKPINTHLPTSPTPHKPPKCSRKLTTWKRCCVGSNKGNCLVCQKEHNGRQCVAPCPCGE